ncbi:MAG: glycosyltransferase family 39 protein [Microthrixaceae bacterium]|nr:glycosyltransferase family 39 protein [Microthrixaceae bacterium]
MSTITDEERSTGGDGRSSALPPWLPIAVFVVVRVAAFAALALAPTEPVQVELPTVGPEPYQGIEGQLTSWDGYFYLDIAENGYPDHVPTTPTGETAQSSVSFFPLYPALIAAVDVVTPGSAVAAAILVTTVAAFVAMLLLRELVRSISGSAAAERAAIMFAVFPGAFVFSLAYTEALVLAFSVGALLAVRRSHWLVAGILAALATATRPDAAVLVLPLAWVAYRAIRTDRDWKALLAPALAPVGAVLALGYIGWQTGVAGAYFRVQNQAFGLKPDFGKTSIVHLRDTAFAVVGGDSVTLGVVLRTAAIIFAVAAFYALWRWRPPAEVWIFAVAVFMAGWLNTLSVPPRVVLRAFPLVAAVGVELKGKLFAVVATVFAALQLLLIYLAVYPGGLDFLP